MHILQAAVLGLGSACHSIFTKATYPHRITKSHIKLSKCPFTGSSTLRKTISPQRTVYEITLLAAWSAGLTGWAPWLDCSRGKEVWKAGSHMEWVWADSSQKTICTWQLQSLWEKQMSCKALVEISGLHSTCLEIVPGPVLSEH